MITLTGSAKIFLCQEVTNMQKSFEGLLAQVEAFTSENPVEGGYFVFLNRRRDRMKVLYWDGDGFALWYKRLEKGSFSRNKGKVVMNRREFLMLLEGVSPMRMQHRYKVL